MIFESIEMQYEIFRAGTRKDANGNLITITAQDLHDAAQSYDVHKHEAPLVIGHPKHDAPAFGWVAKLNVNDEVLTADFSQVDDELAKLVRKGHYKKVSASFYPPQHPNNPIQGKWYLRHVGFLGARPPAVKGLKNIDFADDDSSVISFCEICEPENKENTMTTEEQLAAEKTAREKAEKEAEQAKAELAKLQAEQEQALRDADHKANADFAESLVEQGCLKPADKDLIVQVLDFAEHPEYVTADFGEGDNKKSLSAALKDFLKNGATILPTGETATANRAYEKTVSGSLNKYFADFAEPNALSHHERALALAAKENISYEEAARRTVQ